MDGAGLYRKLRQTRCGIKGPVSNVSLDLTRIGNVNFSHIKLPEQCSIEVGHPLGESGHE